MGDKKGIFSTWLKQFLLLVFTQSFQAIFMTFSLAVMAQLISGVSSNNTGLADDNFMIKAVNAVSFVDGGLDIDPKSRTKYFICSIIAYVSITAIVKMEKLIKQLFGVEDSPLIGDMGKNMKDLMHGARHMMSMAGRINEVRNGLSNAKSAVDKENKIKKRKEMAGYFGKGVPPTNSLEQGNANGMKALGEKVADAVDKAADNKNGENQNGGNQNNALPPYEDEESRLKALRESHKHIDWDDDLRFNDDGSIRSDEQYHEAKVRQAEGAYDLAKRKAVLQTLSTIGSIGVANGASDSFDEAMASADHLDKAVMGVANKVAVHQNKKFQGRNAVEAIKESAKKEADAIAKAHEEIDKSIADSVKKGNPQPSASDIKAAKDAATASIQKSAQSTRKMYASIAKDYDKTFSEKLSATIDEKAKAWKEAANISVNTLAGGPSGASKSERDLIKQARKESASAAKNINNNK